jgi:hypothetical protein
MINSAARNIYYGRDSTQKVNLMQEENSQKVDDFTAPGFSDRFKSLFKDIFPGKTDGEIGKMLGVSKSAMTNYTSKDRVPKTVILFKIRELTGVDFNWLLFNEGQADSSKSKSSPILNAEKSGDELSLKILSLLDACKGLKSKDRETLLHHIEILTRQVNEYMEKYETSRINPAPVINEQIDMPALVDKVQDDHPDIRAGIIYRVITGKNLEDIDSETISIIRKYAGIPEKSKKDLNEISKIGS